MVKYIPIIINGTICANFVVHFFLIYYNKITKTINKGNQMKNQLELKTIMKSFRVNEEQNKLIKKHLKSKDIREIVLNYIKTNKMNEGSLV